MNMPYQYTESYLHFICGLFPLKIDCGAVIPNVEVNQRAATMNQFKSLIVKRNHKLLINMFYQSAEPYLH